VELTGAVNPRGPHGIWSMVGLGCKGFLGRDHLAPYTVVRAVYSHERPDEGREVDHRYVGAGLGLEYAGGSGFDWSLEVLPALVSFDAFYTRGLRAGVMVNMGLGFRLGRRP
jgi:hypothetical protein